MDLSYVIFFASFLYAIGFVEGFLVPKTIDSGASTSLSEALIVNLLLMSLFAIQHSVMARPQFKQVGHAWCRSRSSGALTCCSPASRWRCSLAMATDADRGVER